MLRKLRPDAALLLTQLSAFVLVMVDVKKVLSNRYTYSTNNFFYRLYVNSLSLLFSVVKYLLCRSRAQSPSQVQQWLIPLYKTLDSTVGVEKLI
jgi:hypothetical protein